MIVSIYLLWSFQHAAARRRLAAKKTAKIYFFTVSTRSRPKAAGGVKPTSPSYGQSFNTQPPEGGWSSRLSHQCPGEVVSTRSRPKAAGLRMPVEMTHISMFQHAAARRRLGMVTAIRFQLGTFQHAAARRRLVPTSRRFPPSLLFQHAAARRRLAAYRCVCSDCGSFQHAAARRRLGRRFHLHRRHCQFQHAAARRRLAAELSRQTDALRFQHAAARRRLEPLSKALLHQVSQP